MLSSRSALFARPSLGVALALAWLLLGMREAGGASSLANELGRPILRNYLPGEHLRGLASPAVVQDGGDVMWFSNGSGLLMFDGAAWPFLPLPAESGGVRQFATLPDGTVFMAGPSVLGYLRGFGRDAVYVSLQDQLPSTHRNIDEMRYVTAIDRAVCFSDEEKILVWRNGHFTVIPFPTRPHGLGARLHAVGGKLYVTALDHPLLRLAGDRLEVVADDPLLRENQIISVENGPAADSYVLLTAERGFLEMRDKRVGTLPVEANRWLAGKRIFRALRLADGSRVVAFSAVIGDGGIRFDAEGRYAGPLDMSIGLVVKTIRGFGTDREGGLWLGLEAGAARLEWPSPVSFFDVTNGLGQGGVLDIVRHGGELFAATTEGIFRLLPADENGRMARFERIFNRPAHALASTPGALLAFAYNGVMARAPAGFSPVLRLPADAGTLLSSKRDPARVWIGTTHGVQSIRHTEAGWQDEGRVAGVTGHCVSLSEARDGSLWIATAERGLIRVGFSDGIRSTRLEAFQGGRGLPDRIKRVHTGEWMGEPVFVVDGAPSAFRFDDEERRFVEIGRGDSLASDSIGEGAIAATSSTTGWIGSTAGIYQLPLTGGAARKLPHLTLAATGGTSRLLEEEGPGGSVLWVAGPRGLARVETARAFVRGVPFAARLHATGVRAGEELSSEHAPITFSYSGPRQRPTSPVVFQTRLAGRDRDWSEWDAKRERSFPLIAPGRYRFEVRARDADGIVSAPAALAFVIRSPWWRTWWAFSGYALLGTGLVVGIVRVRTRALRRHAARLEDVVAERTAELARQNEELVRLHQLESEEKIAARLAEEKARLELLRYQLNPHFLFNTLVSISASLPAGRSTARGMVERLAEFCRLTLHRTDDREWTTLGAEVRLLRTYLEIEQSRWGDLLDVEIACDDALANEKLPHFLLLPLLENALKYGRATSPDRVGIRLAARRDPVDDALVVEVANTGEWIAPAAPKPAASLGIGLENLRERLRRYYPRIHQLDVAQAGGWVTVTLRLRPRNIPAQPVVVPTTQV